MREFQRNQRSHWFGHDDAQGNGDRKFEVSVKRKQDHENQHYGERADEIHLRLRLEKLAVFPAPFHPVTLRQGHDFLDRGLAVLHRPFQITSLHAVLHADIAGVVFAIDERRAASLADTGELAQGNLLSVWSPNQQIPDLMRTAPELRLHAHHKIEQLLTLNHLSDRLSAYRGGNHGLHIRDVDPVPRDLVAIDVDQKAGLAKFAHYGKLGKPRHVRKRVLDLYGFVLQNVQIVTIYFNRQRTLEARQRFVYGIFRGLGIVENNSRKGAEFLVNRFDEFVFLLDVSLPRFVLVRPEANVKFTVEEACMIRAVVRTA